MKNDKYRGAIRSKIWESGLVVTFDTFDILVFKVIWG